MQPRPHDTRPPTRFASMLDRQAPGSRHATLRAGSGRLVTVAHRLARAHEFVNPGTPDLLIMAVPDYRLTQALFDLGDGPRDHFCPDPRPVHLLPADTPYRWTVNGASVTVMLAVPSAEVSAILDELAIDRPLARLNRLTDRGFVEPVVHELVMRAWAQARLDPDCAPLLVQGWLVTALHALASRAAARPVPREGGAGLAPARLRAVHDTIEARLHEDLGLDDLAAACGLSRWHFLRAFRAATGHTPYRYLMRRRIERARTLLAAGAGSVEEVAHRTGFADAAHFSRSFAREVGLPPSAYRRAVR